MAITYPWIVRYFLWVLMEQVQRCQTTRFIVIAYKGLLRIFTKLKDKLRNLM